MIWKRALIACVRKAMLASLLARAATGLRFNEHLDEEDGPLVFAHAWTRLVPEGISLPLHMSGRR